MSTEPIWRGVVEMRWSGDNLMLADVMIGYVGQTWGKKWFWFLDNGDYNSGAHAVSSEQDARDALVDTVVAALTGGRA